MKNLVEYIVKALVDNPTKVNISQVEGEKSVIIEVRVAPEDMGKVIGKGGRIAQAIRTLVRASAVKSGKKVMVEIIQ